MMGFCRKQKLCGPQIVVLTQTVSAQPARSSDHSQTWAPWHATCELPLSMQLTRFTRTNACGIEGDSITALGIAELREPLLML